MFRIRSKPIFIFEEKIAILWIICIRANGVQERWENYLNCRLHLRKKWFI